MFDKLFNWLNRNKDKDSLFIIILKLLYKLSVGWIHTILNIILALPLAFYYEKANWNRFAIILTIIVLIEFYFYIVDNYKKYKYQVQKKSALVLDETVALTTSLDDYILNNEDLGKGIFTHASDLVSSSMYKVLKEITGCEVRISVIQQFYNNGNGRKCMMISRKSKKRTSCQSKLMNVEYTKNKDYYYLKILKDNNDTYIFFETKKEIDKNFYWKNKKKKSDIYQYIGCTEKIKTDDVAFLLQIDSMEKNAFGKKEDQISVFVDNYIYPYIQFLKHAYNLERTIREGDESE